MRAAPRPHAYAEIRSREALQSVTHRWTDDSTRWVDEAAKPQRWCAVIPIRALTTRSAGGKDLQESGEEVLNRVYEALIRVANQRDAETENDEEP